MWTILLINRNVFIQIFYAVPYHLWYQFFFFFFLLISMSCIMLGSYRIPCNCSTVPMWYRVPYPCSTVLICGTLCGTVASVVPTLCGTVANVVLCVCRQHYEWIVRVLIKLIKSVKCHTLPSLRRDMDNKIVIHYLIGTLW
jgi:hypothetical protein